MGPFAAMGTILRCDKGAAAVPLKVLPASKVMGTTGPVANIMDHKPTVNVGPFGACSVLKVIPCAAVISSPWIVGSPTVQIGGFPAINKDSKAMCAFGGQIKIIFPGPPNNVIP